MRRRSQTILLRKIAAIRDLQRIAAQAKTSRAATVLRERTDILAERENVQKSGEDDWVAFLTAPTLNVEMLSSWAAILRGQHENVRYASDAVERARSELEQCTIRWYAAELRSDSALELARKAAKDQVRYLEEKTLQEASDRHVQREGP